MKDTKCIAVFGMHTSFGGGKSTGMGLVYESQGKCDDALKAYDQAFEIRMEALRPRPRLPRLLR